MGILTGKRFGQFLVGKQFQSNRLFSVYQAVDPTTTALYYFWTVFPDYPTSDGFSENFMRQLERLRSLDHENLLKISEYGQENGTIFWVTPLIEGKLLSNLPKEPMVEKKAAAIIGGVASAIEYLHSQQVLHGLLSPDTIILDKNNHVWLIHYGLSEKLNQEILPLVPERMTGFPTGNTAYLAPETIINREITVQSDIYAIGAIYTRLLTGLDPFDGFTPAEIAIQKIAVPFPWPAVPKPIVSGTSIRFIYKCMSRRQSDRFKHAGTARKILTQLARGKRAWIRVNRSELKAAPQPSFLGFRLSIITAILLLVGYLFLRPGNIPGWGMFSPVPTTTVVERRPTSSPTATIQAVTNTPLPRPTLTLSPTAAQPSWTPTPYIPSTTIKNNTVSNLAVIRRYSVSAGGALDRLYFSPNNRYLVAGGKKGFSILDIPNDLRLSNIPDTLPAGYPFSSDSNLLATIHNGVRVYQIPQKNYPIQFGFTVVPLEDMKVTFSRDDTLLIVGTNRQTRIWDLNSGYEIYLKEGGETGCQVARSNYNGEILSIFSAFWIFSPLDEMKDMEPSIRNLCRISSQYRSQKPFFVSQDYQRVAFVNTNRVLEMHDTANDVVNRKSIWPSDYKGEIWSIAIAPENDISVVGLKDGTLQMLSGQDGTKLPIPQFANIPKTELTALAFSPDGKYLAAGFMNDAVIVLAVQP